MNFALDKTGNYIEYESYVAKLIDENERHLEFLLKDFEEYSKKWKRLGLIKFKLYRDYWGTTWTSSDERPAL